jgi:transposase
MKQITTIGLNLAKQIFQVHGADADGFPVFNRRLRRAEVLRFFEKKPSCLVGIEACGSSHYWAREIAARGHDVRRAAFWSARKPRRSTHYALTCPSWASSSASVQRKLQSNRNRT